ncbi:MAG: Lrp/AsnC family transcriptional regulator [Candidatus Woesearchaeota archaeon]
MQNIDRDLIFLYSENLRQRLTDLSSLLKKSPQRLRYSLKTFEDERFLHNPHCIFDYSYFGLILFRVYFKGGYISEKDKTGIIKELTLSPYVVSVYELSGEFDLSIELIAPNPSKFNKEFKKLTYLIPTLNNYKVLLNVVTHIYPRFYLTKNNLIRQRVQHEIIVGGDRTVVSFKESELELIKHILFNPKARMTSLAKDASLNRTTALSVFKKLIRKRIIKGFKYFVNTNALGIFRFRLFLKLHNLSQERETEFMAYLSKVDEVVQVNKTVGDWDIEIDIESFSKATVRSIIIGLREQFSDLIETFNSIEFYQSYKKAFLPTYLFES